MSAITIGGDLVHYEVLGRGRPVILVHGWLGSWRYWIPTMQQLHLKYRVYALDLFGFGDSGKNPERYSLVQQIRLMDEFMKALGIPKAAMIGHGLGALILSEFAKDNADKVARLLIASAPIFDPGDLDTRTPAGQRRALTVNQLPSNSPTPVPPAPMPAAPAVTPTATTPVSAPVPATAPVATPVASETPQPAAAPATNSPQPEVLAVPSTPPVDSAAATIPNRADVSKPDSTPTISPAEAPKSESAAPAPTLANRPDLSSHSQPTIPNVNADARARLAAAAAQAGLNYNGDATSVPSSASPGQPSVGMVLSEQNPLQETFAEHKLEDLLARCFKTSEAEYEKLKGDVVKSDAVAIKLSVSTFDSGRMLDMLRLLPMPVVVVHGDEDPIIPKPDEKVWDYLTMDKEDTLLPIPLPNVRHFPMLEHDDFVRLVSQFLEIPDISKLEMKERWVRRTR